MIAVRRLTMAMVLPLLLAAPVLAQNRGQIQGRVVDGTTKQPMVGARVEILGADREVLTGPGGRYRIESVEEGAHKLRVGQLGYAETLHTDVIVVRGKTTAVTEIELVPAPLGIESVTVTAARAPRVSSHSLQREEIRRSPGSYGDVLRAIGMLPGVSTSDGEFSAMSVRGGGAQDNLILIDNVPFDRINHFHGGGREDETQGGRFSILTAGLVERATFYGGGFGAEHGRKGAAVLDLALQEGNPESPSVSGSYDVLGLEVGYSGPTPLPGRTSLLLNYRDFDMRRAVKLARTEEFGDPVMADLVVKTITELGAANRVSLVGIYATDRLLRGPQHLLKGDDLVQNDLFDVDEARWMFGVNWRWLAGARSVLHNTLYHRGNDRFRSFGHATADGMGGAMPTSLADLHYRDRVGVQEQREAEVGWRSDLRHALGRAATGRAGIEVYRVRLDHAYTQNGADTIYRFNAADLRPDPEQRYLVVRPEEVNHRFDDAATHAAAYGSVELALGRWTLTPGMRYDRNGFSRHGSLAPRLQARYQATSATALTFATGVYHQAPLNHLVASAPESRSLRDERSIHSILGVSHLLGEDLQLTVEAYSKSLDRLITPTGTGKSTLANRGTGWNRGIDAILLRRFTDRYHAQVSYSYSYGKRDDHDGLGAYTAPFNEPHAFTSLIGYELNKRWFVSGKWKYASGRPKDRYIVHEDVVGDPERMRYSAEITQRNADRLPDFHALTVRADYRRQIGRLGVVTFLELDNVYNRMNTWDSRFSELTGSEKGLGLGVMGNLGLKLEF